MRTTTAQERALLHDGNSAVFINVEIFDASGVSLGTIGEFVKECEVKASIDDEVSVCEIVIAQAVDKNSLNLLMTESPYNAGGALLNLHRRIKVHCAVVGAHTKPHQNDYKLFFDGYIDTIDIIEDKTLSISARDLGGQLQDRWIETESSARIPPTRLEIALQNVLNKYLPGIILYSQNGNESQPFLPSDNDVEYSVSVVGLNYKSWLNHLRNIYESLGWDIRYKYNAPTNAFQLVAYDIRRDILSTSADDVFLKYEYYGVSQANLNIQNIRNVIQLAYIDEQNNQQSFIVQSGSSISTYGRRWMLVSETEKSLISDVFEASRMANAILKDLSTPFVEMQITIPFNYAVELADYYTFKANGVQFDADTSLAVIAYETKFKISSSGEIESSTSLSLRGKPAGRVSRWINKTAVYSNERIGLRITDTSTNVAARLGNGDFLQYSRG
jgi:hypothetical protein